MMHCSQVRERLLEWLYGLLEPEEAQALESHLEVCPACQEARKRALDMQHLIAQAARRSFPDVRFVPPRESIPLELAHRRPRWRMVAVATAASLLLVVSVSYLLVRLGPLSSRPEEPLVALKPEQPAAGPENESPTKLQAEGQAPALRSAPAESTRAGSERNLTNEPRQDAGPSFRQSVSAHDSSAQVLNVAPGVLVSDLRQNIVVWSDPAEKSPDERMGLTLRLLDRTGNELWRNEVVASAGARRVTLEPRSVSASQAPITLEARAADGRRVARAELPMSTTTPELVLATDRSVYSPGETVEVYATVLAPPGAFAWPDARLQVLLSDVTGQVQASATLSNRLVNERQQPVVWPSNSPVRELFVGHLPLPKTLPAGVYRLTVSDPTGVVAEDALPLTVFPRGPSPYTVRVEWDRPLYRSGELVRVKLAVQEEATPLREQALKLLLVTQDAVLDLSGKPAQTPEIKKTSHDGSLSVAFKVPQAAGALYLWLRLGTDVQPEVRWIEVPLEPPTPRVTFMPEGGALVAGIENRVFFTVQADWPPGVKVGGRICSSSGQKTCDVSTDAVLGPLGHMRAGVFHITPRAGEQYRLILDAMPPLTHDLPPVKDSGLSLRWEQADNPRPGPQTIRIESTLPTEPLVVCLYWRRELVDATVEKVEPQRPARVALYPPAGLSGVFHVAVFSSSQARDMRDKPPLAMAPIYIPSDLRLSFDWVKTTPSGHPRLRIRSHDDQGRPVPSLVSLALAPVAEGSVADEWWRSAAAWRTGGWSPEFGSPPDQSPRSLQQPSGVWPLALMVLTPDYVADMSHVDLVPPVALTIPKPPSEALAEASERARGTAVQPARRGTSVLGDKAGTGYWALSWPQAMTSALAALPQPWAVRAQPRGSLASVAPARRAFSGAEKELRNGKRVIELPGAGAALRPLDKSAAMSENADRGTGAAAQSQALPDRPSSVVVREWAYRRSLAGDSLPWSHLIYSHPALVLPGGESMVTFDLPPGVSEVVAKGFVRATDGRISCFVTRLRVPGSLPSLP
ncbi:MAG: hypothetical protein C4297_02655 [Gemmataceae bacterium]